MKLLRGPIARLVVFALIGIALQAVLMVTVSVSGTRQYVDLVQAVQKRSNLALLSARIRSECLTLTDLVENYIYETSDRPITRAEIQAQAGQIDKLINQAINSINPNDVDESLELGTLRQELIAFSTQATRVLDIYDAENGLGPSTAQEFVFLTESYQGPLIKSLTRFENAEKERASASAKQIDLTATRVSILMVASTLVTGLATAWTIRQIAVRFVLPLSKMRESVERMRNEELDHRVDIHTKDELGELAQALNNMATNLLQSRTQLEQHTDKLEDLVKVRTADLRKLNIVIEQSPNTVVITDPQGIIEYVNPHFTELTGYTPQEALGKTTKILQSGQTPPGTYEQLWATISAGKVWRGEFCNQKKNGEIYWEESVIAPIRNENGEITHFASIKNDITERKYAEDELRRLATLDPLTEALNRRQFIILGEYAISEAHRYGTPVAALMMDADHFKQVNDTYGHQIGDEVLRSVVRVARANLREVDILGRYGGEEFAAILPHTTLENSCMIAERVRQQIEKHTFESGPFSFSVTISIGLAVWEPGKDETLNHLLNKADQALYKAKHTGRNRVSTYNPNFKYEDNHE